jgi:hypothetical protein
MIDTKNVKDRRALRFDSLAALSRELDGLAAAQAAGTLRTLGNWTPGQIFSHLAAFIEYAYDGFPPEIANPPWFVRAFGKLMKKKMTMKSMPVGIRMPGLREGTVGADTVPFEIGMKRLHAAIARLEAAAPTNPSPLLGPLTHEEWIGLHLRHAELHLSFLK